MFDRLWLKEKYEGGETPAAGAAGRLAAETGVPGFMAATLLMRGIRSSEAAEKFFAPDVSDMEDPFKLKDMDKAVSAIIDAIDEGRHITVFGDYDTDGICATAILWHFITDSLEYENLDWYIPSRFDDGYGLSNKAIDLLKSRGTEFIVTVDCGITCAGEVEYARSLGIDVVVTDHHVCQEVLPEALAVVDPMRPDSDYPCKRLCGAGVAYKLIEALSYELGIEEWPLSYLPLAAVATIGDVVPLSGENRVITSIGMKMMRDNKWPGLRGLMKSVDMEKAVSASDISFGIVPRINAAGRMGDGDRALRMLLSTDRDEIELLAEELSQENRKRQTTEKDIMDQVLLPEHLVTGPEDSIVVSIGEDWHQGVVGIVASRLTDRFNKPSIVLTKETDTLLQGSARSTDYINIHDALMSCGNIFEKVGGHARAAGMTLRADRVPLLIAGINRFIAETEKNGIPPRSESAVCDMKPSEISLENALLLERLQPCGEGNPEPVFVIKCLNVISCERSGATGAHLRIRFSDGDPAEGRYGRAVNGFAFGAGRYADVVGSMGRCDILATLSVNRWNGNESVSLTVLDIREAGVYNTSCERDDLVLIYKLIRQQYQSGFSQSQLPVLKRKLNAFKPELTWLKFFNGLGVFTELGILRKENEDYVPEPSADKLDLQASRAYRAFNGTSHEI